VPLLAIPSAAGVYFWLTPHIGQIPAGMTAVGFEILYVSVNILVISTPELRRYARNVALSGVATAIIFNTLYRYQAMIGGDVRAVALDWVALGLAVLESIPLAGLAYAMSVLLHRLSEADAPPMHDTPDAHAYAPLSAAYARIDAPPQVQFSPPQRVELHSRACPKCNAPLDAKQYAAAKRWMHCAACKEQTA
jgi:hypothetical protein